jgi:hypothetical protein
LTSGRLPGPLCVIAALYAAVLLLAIFWPS